MGTLHSCTEEHCHYEVLLQAFGYKHANLFMNRPHLWRLYQAVGGRPAEIRASWEVEAGRVWGKGFGVFVQVPPQPGQSLGGDEGYALIGTSNSVSHFPFGYERVQLVMHPNYVVGTPGGCEICLAVYARFTPFADAADQERLLTFNLACLTAWHACRERGDIMPLAWHQYLVERARWDWKAATDCREYPLELMARDSDNAARAEVISSQAKKDSEGSFLATQLRIIEPLKGMSAWPTGTTHELHVIDNILYPDSRNSQLIPGREYVALFETWGSPKAPDYHSGPCSVIPATPANLDAVKAGIRLDYRAARREAEQR